MPYIGSQFVPIYEDPLPIEIPRPAEILARPGMGAASVLFHAKQFAPLTIRTICTAPDKNAAYLLADKFFTQIRSRQTFDDGIISLPGTVVLRAVSQIVDAGICIGGNGTNDRWEVRTAWTILPDADLDER